MEPKNYKIIKGFLQKEDRNNVINYVNSLKQSISPNNHHLKYLIGKINGTSYMYDISKTELTGKITSYQSGGNVMSAELPDFFNGLINSVCKEVSIPKDHSFLQIVDMNKSGKIEKHYDASFNGFINYKCNISVSSEDYDFCVEKETINVKETDLYCFEASLYKHWTPNQFNSRRILLSFGFMIPYNHLGRDPNDPRVRLSNRIQRNFQK